MKVKASFVGGPLDGQQMLVDYVDMVAHVLGGQDLDKGASIQLKVQVYSTRSLTPGQRETARAVARFAPMQLQYHFKGETTTTVDMRPFITA